MSFETVRVQSTSGSAKTVAKFVPSVVSTNGIDDMKDFFAGKGLHVDGFVQWGQVAADLPSWGQTVDDDACRAHGFCGKSKQISK